MDFTPCKNYVRKKNWRVEPKNEAIYDAQNLKLYSYNIHVALFLGLSPALSLTGRAWEQGQL